MKKFLAILSAFLMGGIGLALLSHGPQLALAGRELN
jgi:hypothetical protein